MTKELGIFILTTDADNINWLIYNKYENKLEFVGTISIIVDESQENFFMNFLDLVMRNVQIMINEIIESRI